MSPDRRQDTVSLYRAGMFAALLTPLCSVCLAQGGETKPRRVPPPGHLMIPPDSVKWDEPPAGMSRGAPITDTASVWRYARLKGDPLKPGAPYTIEFGCTDGSKAGPHWHPTDENILVLRGTFALGMGDAFDTTALRDLTTGSYAFVPKGGRHFGMCKGETLILEYGIGPLTINLLGAANSPPKKEAASRTSPPPAGSTQDSIPRRTQLTVSPASSTVVAQTTRPPIDTNVVLQQATQVVLKRWEFWTSFSGVFLTSLGAVVVALITSRRRATGVHVGPAASSIPGLLHTLSIWAIALLVLLVIPSRIQPALQSPDRATIAAYVGETIRRETDSLARQVSVLVDSSKSLRHQQLEVGRSMDQIAAAVRESRGRMPTEGYVLDRLAQLQDQVAAQRLDGADLRARLELGRSNLAPLYMIAVVAASIFLVAFILLRDRYRKP